MHDVDFFRSDLLKRYRQNTAENRPICSITLDLEGLENLCFRSIIGYTPNRFIQLEFFFHMRFFDRKIRENFFFFIISQFFGYCQYPNDNLMFTERVKVLNSLYNHIKSFLKCCCTFGDNWLFCFKKWSNFWEDREKRRVLNSPSPPIFVYENGHWYQGVAFCELVWMHCVQFFQRRYAEEISAKYCRK